MVGLQPLFLGLQLIVFWPHLSSDPSVLEIPDVSQNQNIIDNVLGFVWGTVS